MVALLLIVLLPAVPWRLFGRSGPVGRAVGSGVLGSQAARRAAAGGRGAGDPLRHHRRFPAVQLPRRRRPADRLQCRPGAGDLRRARDPLHHPGAANGTISLNALRQGNADAIIAGLAITAAAREELDFSDVYLRSPGRFVVRRDAAADRPHAGGPQGQDARRRRADRARGLSRRLLPGGRPEALSDRRTRRARR